MKNKAWFDEFGNFIGKLPKQCIKDCSHYGNCEIDVKNWVNKLNFSAPFEMAQKYCLNTGGWEIEDLRDRNKVNENILWMICCEINEVGEFFGLME
jgi:hypothetical protein